MMRLAAVLALCALCLPMPAGATIDGWPALYDVAGVAADDVLNVRAAPSASAPVIGSLAPDATAVEVVAVNGRETWGLVNLGEGAGWVSLSFLARRPGQFDGKFPDAAQCFGTEPFWSFSWTGDAAAWTTPERTDAAGRIGERWLSISHRGRQAFSARLTPAAGGEALEAVGLLRTEECSDGMSDRRYGYTVDLLLGGRDATLYSGCCSLEDPTVTPRP